MHPSGDCIPIPLAARQRVSILTFKRKPAFDVLLTSHGGFEADVESWFATFATTSSHLDEKVRSFITDADPASH